MEHVLTVSGISFTAQSHKVEGRPDIVIPSAEAYLNPTFPKERLCILGIKTTCKDRWRQVTREGKRVPKKHILNLQKGISEKQLADMESQNVSLVVPEAIHVDYPPSYREKILSVKKFIEMAKQLAN